MIAPGPQLEPNSKVELFEWFVESCRKPKIRSFRQFAEEEVIIPEGPKINTHYKASTQPFSGLLLDQYDSGLWRRFCVTGCVQSGKTFTALVIPLLYFIFEVKEDVIVGVPQMELAEDKWKKEFLPAIQAIPKFAALLPTKGKGSKGGKFESLTFQHGPSIKFMSGRGGDEKRSGYTARIVLATEVDKYDTSAESSREADPISQMEARTNAYARTSLVFLECTVSIPRGRIWQEYLHGSASRIVGQCPKCNEWVTPERDDFTGYEHAKTETQAADQAKFLCPACKADITYHRKHMNRTAKVVHGEQQVDQDGNIIGELPQTKTLGFRWNAFNNLFWDPDWLGVEEWKAHKTADEESGSKESLQFKWATPFEGLEDSIDLTAEDVQRRQVSTGRGQIPENTSFVTIAIDVNKPILHWTAVAWLSDGTGVIIDYGKKATEADKFGVDIGIARSVKWLHDNIGTGWTDPSYKAAVVDCRWKSKEVAEAIDALSDSRWQGYMGYGSGQSDKKKYNHPETTGKIVKRIENKCHMAIHPRKYGSVMIVHADANAWKTELHERFTRDFIKGKTSEGGIALFNSMDEGEHHLFSRHITSEQQVDAWIPGEGRKLIWKAKRSANHWLDSTYMNLPLAVLNGFTFKQEEKTTAVKTVIVDTTTPTGFQTPNGQPYMVTDR